MYYLFLFDKKTKEGKQLRLGLPENTDNPKEIHGHINFDTATKKLSILSLSRGIGDCGTYRTFLVEPGKHVEDSALQLMEFRHRLCSNQPTLPDEATDFKRWPTFKQTINKSHIKLQEHVVQRSRRKFMLTETSRNLVFKSNLAQYCK